MGEAGIGKSRLTAELTSLAEREGAIVLSGRCDEQLGASYLPLRQALGDYLAAYPRDRLPALVGPRGGELVRFWPELAWRVSSLQGPTRAGPDAERYLLFEAVSELLEAIAAAGPVVLVVDDLHWADEASLLLLRHLALASRPPGLFILVACRNDEEPRADLDSTLGDLLRASGAERLTLGGLETGEVAALAEMTLGRPLGPGGAALARVLRERTGGNPFFAGELLRHLSETRSLASAGADLLAAGPASDDIPEPVRLIVKRRIARLGPPVERVLGVAAVIGHNLDLTVLSRVADLGYEDLLAAVEAAVRARLLDERAVVPGGYAFHHAIVHDLVYAGIPAARRALLHHLVGAAIEGLHGGTTRLRELADHFALGSTPGDAVKAVDYATRAGDQAVTQLLYEEAARRYRQALAVLDRVDGGDLPRCDLLLALGDALTRGGQAARATEAYLEAADAARGAGLPDHLARARALLACSAVRITRRG